MRTKRLTMPLKKKENHFDLIEKMKEMWYNGVTDLKRRMIMKKAMVWWILILFSLIVLGACGDMNAKTHDNSVNKNIEDNQNNYQEEETDVLTYKQITAKEAKQIMETEKEYIIIDARTEEEFAQGHIKDAILIPEYEITERAKGELPNKDALILVYCRSGRRSKIAAEELIRLGYTNVKEFGGIIDWPYEIVK